MEKPKEWRTDGPESGDQIFAMRSCADRVRIGGHSWAVLISEPKLVACDIVPWTVRHQRNRESAARQTIVCTRRTIWRKKKNVPRKATFAINWLIRASNSRWWNGWLAIEDWLKAYFSFNLFCFTVNLMPWPRWWFYYSELLNSSILLEDFYFYIAFKLLFHIFLINSMTYFRKRSMTNTKKASSRVHLYWIGCSTHLFWKETLVLQFY